MLLPGRREHRMKGRREQKGGGTGKPRTKKDRSKAVGEKWPSVAGGKGKGRLRGGGFRGE